ncbi:hypothetical protein [Bacillus sp. NMCC4]|uniref:hypothetical protein n=1 Tax=Bacillus TaxID=1386 RepID=UPI00166FB3EE|nr:hypothetical protein [Bacillus sp. NMCC4]
MRSIQAISDRLKMKGIKMDVVNKKNIMTERDSFECVIYSFEVNEGERCETLVPEEQK